MIKCPVCKEWGFPAGEFMGHKCKPNWECRMEWEDDWTPIYASDAELAAEKCAEIYDCEGWEYAIVSQRRSGENICVVNNPRTDEVTRWLIEAESLPHYYAKAEP